MTGNKLRLYLAYYRRNPTPNQPARYHTSFIVAPKNPQVTDYITVLHVTNRLDRRTLTQLWKFESKTSQARTNQLTGLMLLGKVPPNFTVENITQILTTIPVKQEEDWWCHDWIMEAMPALVENGIIPKLSDPQEVLNTAYEFVETATQGSLSKDQPVPTCNIVGRRVASEFGAFE
ncbi:hypothetical protein M413DRAFT_26639 [Hebeloma cylindrosporum]|uniref:Uncharacterized protein n=1 Tax=Hebeloma cylindrosporum TaxID=76867 RepID=A0A0C3C191_HEBCY|nr:hypothetical protein M413DRAFT_26639 [Hebeloma cylindrosporum h7]